MKLILIALIAISGQNLFAGEIETKQEVLRVARVLVDNSELVSQINNEGVSIVDYLATEVSNGVTEYKFKLGVTCFCIPKSGELRIVQDLTPTYADGPVKYESSLVIDPR